MTKHNLDLKGIFVDAFDKFKKNVWFLICLFLGVLIISMITDRLHPIINLIINLIIGISMVTVSLVIADNKKPNFNDITKSFHNYKITLNYVIATVIYMIAVFIGTLFLIIPGIYIAIRLHFYKFLVIENENMSPIDTLKQSMKMSKDYFWSIAGFIFMLLIINIIGAIPFGIGLIITIPVSVIAGALLYKKLLTSHHSVHHAHHEATTKTESPIVESQSEKVENVDISTEIPKTA